MEMGINHRSEMRIFFIYAASLIAVVFLQKFGIPVGSNVIIPAGLPGTAILMLTLLPNGLARINADRLALYLLFMSAGIVNLLLYPAASSTSFYLVAVLASFFIFEVPVDKSLFLRCMRVFVGAMLLTAPIVVLEWGLQFALGPGLWINLEFLVPDSFLVPDYMYRHPTSFGSPWMQPNAALFLEVSILSQFLAIALIFELAYFKRPAHLAILFITMLVTMGGSGPFLLALSLPFLIFYVPRKLMLPALLFVAVTIGLMLTSNLFSDFTGRIDEFNNPRGSAYGRYVIPFRILAEQFTATGGTYFGHGAGSGDKVGASSSIGKLIYEYGWIGGGAYIALAAHMLTKSGHKFIAIWALALFISILGGGLAVPLYPLACFVLGGMLVVQDSPVLAPADHAPTKTNESRVSNSGN